MLINEKYLIGYIKNTHNLKGELICNIEDYFINNFLETEQVFIDIDKLPVPFFIEQSKRHNNLFIVKFQDIDNIDDAKELVGLQVFIDKKNQQINTSYLSNLKNSIEYNVLDTNNKLIGKVYDFIDFDKNKLLIVKTTDNKEVLIPVNKNFILKIDDKNIIVDLPEGLIDLNEKSRLM